jgi:hypothetical protein
MSSNYSNSTSIDDCIIDSFIDTPTNSLNDITEYVKLNLDKFIDPVDVRKIIKKYIKHKILYLEDKTYLLTEEGNIIKQDNKNYYSRMETFN